MHSCAVGYLPRPFVHAAYCRRRTVAPEQRKSRNPLVCAVLGRNRGPDPRSREELSNGPSASTVNRKPYVRCGDHIATNESDRASADRHMQDALRAGAAEIRDGRLTCEAAKSALNALEQQVTHRCSPHFTSRRTACANY